jgi:hypothetical protein
MPTAKKTKAKKPAKSSPKKDTFSPVLDVLKIIGIWLVGFFKFLIDLIIKLLQIILKFAPLAIASIAIAIVCIALSIYLLSAAIGLKSNVEWQEYISDKVHEWVQAEKDIRGENESLQ